ncbi:MAG: hypothetical protein B6I38_00075 [Anaerolineaceae bacterium 4572_5.1]|nr:MAG: hypothetical protein B6I38_00075 [Anaerolineaceae bacterium 4572_5.1]
MPKNRLDPSRGDISLGAPLSELNLQKQATTATPDSLLVLDDKTHKLLAFLAEVHKDRILDQIQGEHFSDNPGTTDIRFFHTPHIQAGTTNPNLPRAIY